MTTHHETLFTGTKLKKSALEVEPIIDKNVDWMQRMIRGEYSALDAYRQCIEKLTNKAEKSRLMAFYNDHENNLYFWKGKVGEKFVKPEDSSGIWGDFVSTFMKSAKIFGDETTLNALKRGEEHGLSEYQRLLELDEVPLKIKKIVKEHFIPQIETHISSIEALKSLH